MLNNMLKRGVVAVLMLSVLMPSAFLLSACAGRTPNPVQIYQTNDELLTCDQIHRQMADNQSSISSLMPKTQKTGKNVALGAAGAFFIVPWFFMDFSDAERIEIESYSRRNNYLYDLGERRHCKNMLPRVQLQAKG